MLRLPEYGCVVAVKCEDFLSDTPAGAGALNLGQFARYGLVGAEEDRTAMLAFGQLLVKVVAEMRRHIAQNGPRDFRVYFAAEASFEQLKCDFLKPLNPGVALVKSLHRLIIHRIWRGPDQCREPQIGSQPVVDVAVQLAIEFMRGERHYLRVRLGTVHDGLLECVCARIRFGASGTNAGLLSEASNWPSMRALLSWRAATGCNVPKRPTRAV